MGIQCEINLFKPLNGEYKPGSIVSGVIKYSIDEETEFNYITVSLKGIGHLHITRNTGNGVIGVCNLNETLVDEDNVVSDKEKTQASGSYETQFSFQLPLNIPPSFKYRKHIGIFNVRCKIIYYVRIKFDRPGFLNFTKRFKKEIDVVSGINPVLPMEPIIYGEQKILKHLLSSKPNIIKIKAIIDNSIVKPEGKIKLNYELLNDTNTTITAVKCKLIEAHKFSLKDDSKNKINDHKNKVIDLKTVNNTKSKTSCVKTGDTQNMDVEIDVPLDITSLSFSKLVSREHYVEIKAELPIPHRDMVLKVPVQIGEILEENVNDQPPPVAMSGYDQPPPYWEVMGEEKEELEK